MEYKTNGKWASVTCVMSGLLLWAGTLAAQGDIRPDSWVAVDELGREMPGADVAGEPRANRTVGLFYYIWLNETAGWEIHDISKILEGQESWGGAPSFHHYGESLYGYYSSKDEYVIRRHMQMITDAGVDFIFFDNTNGTFYQDVQEVILNVLLSMRLEGQDVPQVSWAMYNGDVNAEVEGLYDTIATNQMYADLLFRWGGKPLLLGFYTGGRAEVAAHFTFRKSWAWTNQPWFTATGGAGCWPWLDNYPQNPGLDGSGSIEQMTVSAAQHPHGQYAIGKSCGEDVTQTPVLGTDGKYFELQWSRALEVDPPLVMVTQWNEWIAQRFIKNDPTWDVAAVSWMAREPLASGDSIFIDVYTPEYSRDLEPLRTAYRDNMYMQIVDNVRRYKGVRPVEVSAGPADIDIDGDFSEWEDVQPVYLDDVHDVVHRDHVSFGSDVRYTNDTGRNDIAQAKVAFDETDVYFHVETLDALTPSTDPSWMLLLLNADADYTTGWQGYDYAVNLSDVQQDTTSMMAFTGPGFAFGNPRLVDCAVRDNQFVVKIPADAIGVTPAAGFTLDFKWVDNSLHSGDILDLYVDGDAAPNGRFNYRFTTGGPVAFDTDSSTDTESESGNDTGEGDSGSGADTSSNDIGTDTESDAPQTTLHGGACGCRAVGQSRAESLAAYLSILFS